MTIEEKIPLETIWRREKKLSSLIHSLTEAKLIHLHWFLALTNRRCVLSTLYTRFLKLWNQYQTYNFSASFKSCCPSCNFLSCRAAILVLFYFVTPLCAKDLVTGHLLLCVGITRYPRAVWDMETSIYPSGHQIMYHVFYKYFSFIHCASFYFGMLRRMITKYFKL